MPDLTGRTLLRRYRVDAFVGRGGMAEVYRAWDSKRSVYIALKVLNEDLAEDYVFLRRFAREARALELLQHPHTVRFFGFEESQDLAFLVMEYIDGVTLRRQLKLLGRPLTLPEALTVLQPVCSALHYAHGMGIYHCDIKPANIFIERGGRVVLGDFGIARLSESATVTFSTPGAPAYMAPEQCRGEELDARTDIYSLGITTYEMLTLDRPFKGDTQETMGSRGERVRWEQMHVPPPRPRGGNPDIPSAAETAILRALEKEPERRQQGALEFYDELSEGSRVQAAGVLPWVLAGEPEKRRVRMPSLAWGVLGAVVLLFLVAILGVALMSSGGNDDADEVATMAVQLTTEAPRATTEVATPLSDISAPTSTQTPRSTSTPAPTNTPLPTSTPTPTPTPTSPPQPIVTFWDGFDGSGLDTSKWSLDTGTGDVIVSGGVLRMASSGRRYPYIYSRYDPFPSEGNFQMSFRFRYSEVKVCGVGVIMTGYLVPVGLTQDEAANRQREAEAHGVQAGVWQDETNGMQLWFRSGADRVDIPISGPNTDWNEMTIRCFGNQYTLYLNGHPAYTSLETPYYPQGIWIGHPAELGTDCRWSTLEIDYIKVESLP